MTKPLSFAFVVPCYHEAQNVPSLLRMLDRTAFDGRRPSRIVVVSDVSADGTDDFVRRFANKSATPVRLICNAVRRGKSSAINQALREVQDIDVIFMISGDVLPEDSDCIRRLIEPFDDPRVGVAGGRQVAVGPSGNLASDITRYMWALHHVIAMRHPKTTEVTVFRNVIAGIDRTSLVDEAAIELAIQRRGYDVRYVPDARILSPAPMCLTDYIRQRSNVTLGYLRLSRDEGHTMDTQKTGERLRAVREVWRTRKFPVRTAATAVFIEIVVRLFAWTKFVARFHRHGIWGRSDSTKRDLGSISQTSCGDTEAPAVVRQVSA